MPPVYLAVSRSAASVGVAISCDLPIHTRPNIPDGGVMGIRSPDYQKRAAAGKATPGAAPAPSSPPATWSS